LESLLEIVGLEVMAEGVRAGKPYIFMFYNVSSYSVEFIVKELWWISYVLTFHSTDFQSF